MQNIEIKARIGDLEETMSLAASLSGSDTPLLLKQVDTYFNVEKGRLKLREITGDEVGSELIYYERQDEPGPKYSDYQRVELSSSSELGYDIKNALGVSKVVAKRRAVYFYRNARIHLDEVEGLGSFLEIEVVLTPENTEQEGQTLIQELMQRLQITKECLVEGSYCDLI